MYHQEGERILREELPKIGLRVLSHAQFANLLDYLHRIPLAWYALGDPGRGQAHTFLESGPDDQVVAVLPVALDIPVLRETACQRLATLFDDDLAQLIQQGSHLADYFPEAQKRWGQSESFEESKRLTRQFLAPFLSTDLAAEQVTQIILACAGNFQLHDHFQTIRLFKTQLFPLSEAFLDQTKEAWIQLYEQFCWFPVNKLDRRPGLIQEQEWLLDSIEERYPDVTFLVTKRMQEKYHQEDDDVWQ